MAVLSNIVDASGDVIREAKDRLVVFLAGIQHETTISSFRPGRPASDNQYVLVTPPLYINLYLLLYANFQDKNYKAGLEMISGAIQFFQENPVFGQESLPGLDPRIDKLSFEITNLDLTELNYLMGLAGVNYLPSAYYKVRTIPFESDAVTGEVPAVTGYSTPGELEDDLDEPDES